MPIRSTRLVIHVHSSVILELTHSFVATDAVWVTVCLAMIGKFGIAASFAVFYVFVGELLPTVLRSQAMGIASFIAGIGLLAFPYIVHLAVYSRVLPLIIMGTLSVAGALTSIFLPETLNIHLPQTIEEGELFGADFKLWSCPTLPKSVLFVRDFPVYFYSNSRVFQERETRGRQARDRAVEVPGERQARESLLAVQVAGRRRGRGG